jgi:hypothetical protein
MSGKKTILTVLGLCASASLTACHTPGGGLFAHAGGPETVISTDTMQKSVRMVDLRSGEVFFAMDIPPGKQLTFDFDRDAGDDPVYTPDFLYWEVKDIGDKFGRLDNTLTVPNAASRRVDIYVRQAVQYAAEPQQQGMLRTDQMDDRPDWWTPRGGAMPDDRRHNLYDD